MDISFENGAPPMPNRLLRLAAIPVLAWAAVSFAADDYDDHVAEANGLRVVHAWARATTGPEALVFADIENDSGADVLLQGGASDLAASVELVGFELRDGEPAYTRLPAIPVRNQREVVLAPNGLALRLNGLTETLVEGDEIEISIVFDVGPVDVHVEVGASDAAGHSHAGHAH